MSTSKPPRLPTLTEVIEVAADESTAATEPLPLAPESMPLESLQAPPQPVLPRLVSQQALIDAVVQRLQPKLDAWLQTHATRLAVKALRAQADDLARTLARELSADLQALARDALDELRKDVAARPPRR